MDDVAAFDAIQRALGKRIVESLPPSYPHWQGAQFASTLLTGMLVARYQGVVPHGWDAADDADLIDFSARMADALLVRMGSK